MEASSDVGVYTSEKSCPQKVKNINIATEIASISVSVVKLLVLPVWGTVSTPDLYLTLIVLRSRTMLIPVEIGCALKHCRCR